MGNMTNPSYQYMEQMKREERAKLLGIRREQVVKSLDGLHLHGDSHAMLSQIAYAVFPRAGAWDESACERLRHVLTELIGDAREAESDTQHVCACGIGDCHSGNESKEVDDGMAGGGRGMREDSGDNACGRMDYSDVHQEVVGYPTTQYDVLDNERHKAVCELSKLDFDPNSVMENQEAIANALGVDYKFDEGFSDGMRRRLIHLLGGNEYYVLDMSKAKTIGRESDVSESDDGTSITNGTMGQSNETCPNDAPSTSITDELRWWASIKVPHKYGLQLTAIADRIDESYQDAMQSVHDSMEAECNKLQAERDEYRKEMVDSYRIAATFCETFYDECRMYRDMLNEAAGEYKAPQDKLDIALDACKSIN